MAENSKIAWTDHTFNAWRGCTKVSDGCKNCYAEKNMSVKFHGIKWGPNGDRVVASDSMWKEPVRWNKHAAEGQCRTCKGTGFRIPKQPCAECEGKGTVEPYRLKVFCASLADIFEAPDTMPAADAADVEAARFRLFALIANTPQLDWLLLTKRPDFAYTWMRENGYHAFNDYRLETEQWPAHNIWIGTTVENQQAADERIPHLLKIPAAVRFLSVEPLLGPVDLTHISTFKFPGAEVLNSLTGILTGLFGDPCATELPAVDWVIVGGESGPQSRACDVSWIGSVVDQCKASDVPVFVKQLGAHPFLQSDCVVGETVNGNTGYRLPLKDKKGGLIDEWPDDLRIREVPECVA